MKSTTGCTNTILEALVLWGDCRRQGGRGTVEFQQQLDSMLNLAPAMRGFSRGDPDENQAAFLHHVRTLIRSQNYPSWQDDYNFFVDQLQGERKQKMEGAYLKLAQRERRATERASRRDIAEDRQKRDCPFQRVDSSAIAADGEEQTATSSEEVQDVDEAYAPPQRQLQRWKSASQDETVNISIPKRELMKAVSEVSMRCNLSHRKSVALTATLVKAGGGSLSSATLSKSSSHRHRTSQLHASYNEIVSNFKENMPQFIILHWDGKIIKYAHQKKSDERLAIAASFPGIDRPSQFLDAPQLVDGTGSSMTTALKATLEHWGIPENAIVGLSWDTTSSNTGAIKGSSTLMEQELGSARLWLACRHHIGELHVKHVYQDIRGTTTGPTNTAFQRFRDAFNRLPSVPPSSDLCLWEWPEEVRPYTLRTARALEVRQWAEQRLLQGSFRRGDYRELCELVVIYLGGEVLRPRQNGPPVQGFKLQRPGALHHARFMHHGLYILKMVMLSDEIDCMSAEEEGMVKRLAEFIALFHAPHYLQASLAAAAPRLDLSLWKLMEAYAAAEPIMANAAQRSALRHLWYLTEEAVILALFDPEVSAGEKLEMAQTLLAQPRQETYPPGKPVFPAESLLHESQTLASFIGARSWLLFNLLGVDGQWLNLQPSQWPNNEGHNMAKIVLDLTVVNDAAERGVKDVTDYAEAARDGQVRARIITVVSSHRMKAPNLQKGEFERM